MNIEPIINARFKQFKNSYALTHLKDGEAFERFVNHAILKAHQPDAFSADDELLDKVCVGGNNDMGIDGLAIKLNGLLMRDIKDIDDILDKFKRASVEFIFIQSKYKPEFKATEFNSFIAGVRDFLGENHLQPMNDAIQEFLKMKEYLLSEDVVVLWEKNPSIRLYYVAMGRWRNTPHILAHKEQFKNDISNLNSYTDPEIHFVDSEHLKNICDSNENTFKAIINAIDTMPLTAVKGVDNSSIILCSADEFLSLITTEDGIIRKSLFDDNVRDYQGDNSVNSEIGETIINDPEKFIILNNGITIVCDEFIQNNRQVTMKNPQIVNGCQTSHVIYNATAKGLNVSKVPLNIKIISTKDMNIINQIVRGTNRQNIVYDEAFEATKKFHKDLEEFFDALSPDYQRIYYERRSKQYQHDPRIKQIQKINLRILTQSFVAMFLNQPHVAHRHESRLLREFANSLYQEYHSRLPYFTCALSFYKLENHFRDNYAEKREYYPYRAHLLTIMREYIAGSCPSLNSEKETDVFCKVILDTLKDDTKTSKAIHKTKELFQQAKTTWTTKLNKSLYGIKDIREFTDVLIDQVKKSRNIQAIEPKQQYPERHIGKIVKIIVDRYGEFCGFIERRPDNIFFHSRANRNLPFFTLEGKYVSYEISTNPRNNQPVAISVKLEETSS